MQKECYFVIALFPLTNTNAHNSTSRKYLLAAVSNRGMLFGAMKETKLLFNQIDELDEFEAVKVR